jgi:hypothetical protein
MFTIGQLLALHAVVATHRPPGHARLLAALDHTIDTYPRTEETTA